MIKIFYLSYCPHSMKAVETLNSLGMSFEKIQVDDNKQEVIEKHQKITDGYRYFPQIFFETNNKIGFIGGNDVLQKAIEDLKKSKIPDAPKTIKRNIWLQFLHTIAQELK